MFKPQYGKCSACGATRLIVVKKGWCKECNEKRKNALKDFIKELRIEKLTGTKEEKLNKLKKLLNKKEPSRSKLIKELDKWFSLFIRLRFADNKGLVVCFTSGKQMHYKQSQCGHFISRRHLATRWDEINCQVQSVRENIFNQGNAPVFGQRLNEKYGAGTTEKLLIKSGCVAKYDTFTLKLLIAEYQKKVTELRKTKGL